MNERILRSELAKNGMTQKDLAKALKITESTMIRKIKGLSGLNSNEINTMINIFNIPITQEYKNLFF